MPQAYDYAGQMRMADPADVFLQSLQIGQQLKKQAQQRELMERRQATYAKLGPNATSEDFIAAATALPEDSEALLRIMKARDEASNKAMFDAGGKAWSQLTPGAEGQIDPSRAIATLEEYAAAMENSGKADMAQQFRDAAKAVELNPANGRTVLGTMLAMADPTKFKAIAEIGENKIAKDIENLAAIVGPEVARNMVVGREAAKGVVAVTGPSGTSFIRAEDMFNLPPEQQGQVAAKMAATPDDTQNSMSVDQYREYEKALGGPAAAGLSLKRYGIPIRVKTPAEARALPRGTAIILPDGRQGVVP